MAKNNVDRVDMVPACQDLVIILKSFFIGTQGCVGTEAVVVITNCVKREREGGRAVWRPGPTCPVPVISS